MLLSEWIVREGITRSEFAVRVGVSPSVITELCNGGHWLGRSVAQRIERETRGEVTSQDFVWLGTNPGEAASNPGA